MFVSDVDAKCSVKVEMAAKRWLVSHLGGLESEQMNQFSLCYMSR